MKKFLLALAFLLPTIAFGQSTTLSGTTTDSDSTAWANGTYSISFVPNPQYPASQYIWQGAPINSGPYTSGVLDGAGAFSISLPDNAFISPAGSKWQIVTNPNAAAGSSTIIVTVTGGSQSVTTQLGTAAIAPRFSPGQYAFGYKDIEVITPRNPGGTYYDVTDMCFRVWSGSAWGCTTGSSGVTGSGTANTVAKWTGTSTLGNSTGIDDGTHYSEWPDGLSTETLGLGQILPNDASGTTVQKSVCVTVTRTAKTCGTTDLVGIAGAAVEGAGTTGNVRYCITQCVMLFDNQTTIGHIAVESTTVAGEFHDTGSTLAVAGVDAFLVDSVNGGAGTTAIVDIMTPRNIEINSNTSGGKTTVKINENITQATADFSSSALSPDANFGLATFKRADTGLTTQAIVEVPWGTNAAKGLVQADGTSCTITSGVISCTGSALVLSGSTGLGDGTNAIAAATYLQSNFFNSSGKTWTLTGFRCFTDNNGTSTMNVTNGANTALLTGAITCTNTWAAGTQSGTTTIANGDYLKFTFVADGTTKQTTWEMSFTQ